MIHKNNPYNPRSKKAQVWEEGYLMAEGRCIEDLRVLAREVQDKRFVQMVLAWGTDYLAHTTIGLEG